MKSGDQDSAISRPKKISNIQSVFKKGVDQQSILAQVKPEVLKTLQSYRWSMSYGDYRRWGWQSIFSSIQISYADELYLHNNLCLYLNCTIMKSLSHPIFKCLTVLHLQNNCITSIEVLPFLHLQKLQFFRLDNNLITNFKPLAKTRWNDIWQLFINQNKVYSLQLNRYKVDMLFSNIRLDPDYTFSYQFLNDYRGLSKFQSQGLEILNVGKRRIKQKSILISLCNKYPKMNLRETAH